MKILLSFIIILSFLLCSCATSTGSRYGKKDSNNAKTDKTSNKELKEEFDITPYKSTIDIDDTSKTNRSEGNDPLWYGYPVKEDTFQENAPILNQLPGFRVLVYTSDLQEQAEYVKSDIYFKTKKNTYLVFEPPFYKVKAGDFTKQKDASDFSFKLNQLGFSEAKVIRDTINIYK